MLDILWAKRVTYWFRTSSVCCGYWRFPFDYKLFEMIHSLSFSPFSSPFVWLLLLCLTIAIVTRLLILHLHDYLFKSPLNSIWILIAASKGILFSIRSSHHCTFVNAHFWVIWMNTIPFLILVSHHPKIFQSYQEEFVFILVIKVRAFILAPNFQPFWHCIFTVLYLTTIRHQLNEKVTCKRATF